MEYMNYNVDDQRWKIEARRQRGYDRYREDRRLGGEFNREVVPFHFIRACERASGCLVEFDVKRPVPLSPFAPPSFPFSRPHAPSLLSSFSWAYR